MELLIGCCKTFPQEIRGQIGKIMYAMGGRSERACACDGGGGQISTIYVRTK